MDESWQDVAILDVEVVVWPEDVGGDDSGEAAAVLLEVAPEREQWGGVAGGLSISYRHPPLWHRADPSQQHLHLLSPGISPALFNSWESQGIPLALIISGCLKPARALPCPPPAPILDVNHPLGIGVAKVGAVRWPVVNLETKEHRVKS